MSRGSVDKRDLPDIPGFILLRNTGRDGNAARYLHVKAIAELTDLFDTRGNKGIVGTMIHKYNGDLLPVPDVHLEDMAADLARAILDEEYEYEEEEDE